MLLTLIIGTKGRTRQLRRLLDSLRRQTEMSFRIILIDQNEPGFLTPLVNAFPELPLVHIYAAPPYGVSRARNIGITIADTPLIGFPDDDCWYRPTTVAEVVERFERDPQLDVLTGRTVDSGGQESISMHLPTSQRITRANIFVSGNTNACFVRREAAIAVDGFDESLGVGSGTIFGSGEETDFLIRCLNAGFTVRYDRSLVVHHDQVKRDPATVGSYSTGFGRVARLHGMGAGFVATRILRAAIRSCLFLVGGNVDQARSRWLWIRGCLVGFIASPSQSGYGGGDGD